jgi:hypothetical protein
MLPVNTPMPPSFSLLRRKYRSFPMPMARSVRRTFCAVSTTLRCAEILCLANERRVPVVQPTQFVPDTKCVGSLSVRSRESYQNAEMSREIER